MSNNTSDTSSISALSSVAAKVYGVVALCLTALACVVGVATYQLSKIGQELDNIATVDAPLTAVLTEVTLHQLEQAILFERALRAGEVMDVDEASKKVFEESIKKFDKYNQKVDVEFQDAQNIIAIAKNQDLSSEERELFNSVSSDLSALAITHKSYAEHAHQAFALVEKHDLKTLFGKLPGIGAEEELLDSQLERLLLTVEKFTIDAVKKANKHEHEALSQLIWISAIAVLLGGVLSWLAVRTYITNPLGEVASGVSALCRGDLTVDVPKRRDDEIGVIADGLAQFRESAGRIEALQKEKEQADLAAAEARQAMMAQLRNSFAVVVDGAIAGEFSGRVDQNFDDPELNGLARGVNELLEVVEAGLNESGRVMASVAEGDLSCRMDGSFKGAFADLQNNTNRSVERLGAMIQRISTTTSDVLINAESISSDSVSLASKAEQQASSLEETAATMEEMSASVKSNAERATDASDQATKTLAQVDEGGRVATEAIAVVSEIENSSSKIADIIAVIDGISFQTNLLALNAAVEAARAGDAGKGFAVVASEVRALAQRSSDAALDIRKLIETSADQVQEGVKLVTKTGEILGGVVKSIGKVEEAIGAIANASSEQSTGVQEISTAVSHLDEITQSNASLADEGASNARRLNNDVQSLRTLIGGFRLGDGAQEQASDQAWGETEKSEAVASAPAPAPAPARPQPAMAAAGEGNWSDF